MNSKIEIISDFDGTATRLGGKELVCAPIDPNAPTSPEHQFYRTLFEYTGVFNYSSARPLPVATMVEKMKSHWGSYSNELASQNKSFITPDALNFYKRMLSLHPTVKIHILTLNHVNYVKALFKYQGFSDEEIEKLDIQTAIGQGKRKAVSQFTIDSDAAVQIYEDSPNEAQNMAEGLGRKQIERFVHEPGQFPWDKYAIENEEKMEGNKAKAPPAQSSLPSPNAFFTSATASIDPKALLQSLSCYCDDKDQSKIESILLRGIPGSFLISPSETDKNALRLAIRVRAENNQRVFKYYRFRSLADGKIKIDGGDTYANFGAFLKHVKEQQNVTPMPHMQFLLAAGDHMQKLHQLVFGEQQRAHAAYNWTGTLELLRNKPNYTALIRPSASIPNAIVIAYVKDGEVMQHRFLCMPGNKLLPWPTNPKVDASHMKEGIELPHTFVSESDMLTWEKLGVPRKQLNIDIRCPITLDMIQEPVTLSCCNATLEESALTALIQSAKRIECPCCFTTLTSETCAVDNTMDAKDKSTMYRLMRDAVIMSHIDVAKVADLLPDFKEPFLISPEGFEKSGQNIPRAKLKPWKPYVPGEDPEPPRDYYF